MWMPEGVARTESLGGGKRKGCGCRRAKPELNPLEEERGRDLRHGGEIPGTSPRMTARGYFLRISHSPAMVNRAFISRIS